MKIAKFLLIISLIPLISFFLIFYNRKPHYNEIGGFNKNNSLERFFDVLYASQDELGCPRVADKIPVEHFIEKTESYSVCEMQTFRFPSLEKSKVELKFEDNKLRLYANFLPFPGKYDTYSILPEPKLSKEQIYQSIAKMSSTLFKNAIGNYIFSSEFSPNGIDSNGKCSFPIWYVSWSREINGIPLRFEGGSASLHEKFGWKVILDFSVSTKYIREEKDADRSFDTNKTFTEIMKSYFRLINTTCGDSYSSLLNSSRNHEVGEAHLCYINPRFFVPFSVDQTSKKDTAVLAWEIPIVLFSYDDNSKKIVIDTVYFWVDSKTKTPLGFGCSNIPDKHFFS